MSVLDCLDLFRGPARDEFGAADLEGEGLATLGAASQALGLDERGDQIHLMQPGEVGWNLFDEQTGEILAYGTSSDVTLWDKARDGGTWNNHPKLH